MSYFAAVAVELNFTRAAAGLHMSQQALSAAIRRLEQRLGARLFDRTPRGVHLTTAGEALLPAALATLAAAEQTVKTARDAAGGLDRRITLGASRSAQRFGAALVSSLQRTPRVEVNVRVDLSGPPIDELLSGGLDAVIVFCPEIHPGLRYLRLSDQPAIASLDPDHSLAGAAALSLADIRDMTFVLAPEAIGRGYNAAVLSLCRGAGFEPATAESVGFLPPTGMRLQDLVGITTEAALDGILDTRSAAVRFGNVANHDRVRVPVVGLTLPFDLVWRSDWNPPALETLLDVARRVATQRRWPRN